MKIRIAVTITEVDDDGRITRRQKYGVQTASSQADAETIASMAAQTIRTELPKFTDNGRKPR